MLTIHALANAIPNIYILGAALLVFFVSLIKYPSGDINYKNSDATFHTLLMMTAYEETPATIHKSLPIVSLRGTDDKGISWGACIPDKYGNYYYTSFSPAGYVLPYLYVKCFHLPIAESSLYIFNSLLFAVSLILFILLIDCVYRNTNASSRCLPITLCLFVFAPEMLHGMGIVYWHQSVIQVTLIAQILAFYQKNHSKLATVFSIFYVLQIHILSGQVMWLMLGLLLQSFYPVGK